MYSFSKAERHLTYHTMSTLPSDSLQQEDPTSLFRGGLVDGHAAVRGLKRKLDTKEEPVYESNFEQTEVKKVHANIIQPGDSLEFDFPSWEQSARLAQGLLNVEFQLTDIQGNAYPVVLDSDDMRGKNVFIRPGLLHNWIKSIEFIVNGVTLHETTKYDTIAKLSDLLTMTEDRAESERQATGYGMYRRLPITKETGRAPLTDGSLNWLGPNTQPSQVRITSATEVTIKEQAPYQLTCSEYLPGSRTIRLMGYLKSPIFNNNKLLPMSFPFRLRLVQNDVGQLVQCPADQVPILTIKKAYFKDPVFKLTPEYTQKIARHILTPPASVVLPVERREIIERDLPKGTALHINRAVTGVLPRRMAIALVENSAWRAQSPTKNPYDFSYHGITGMMVKYGEKEYPYAGGYKLEDVPLKGADEEFSTEDIKHMVRRNFDVYRENMSVFMPESDIHKADLKAEDWFAYNNIWCFDFTPLGRTTDTKQVQFPRHDGHLDIYIDLKKELPKNYTVLIMLEYFNTFSVSVPDFQIERDY